MDPLRLRAEVPERAAHKVQAGQKVRVTVEGDPNIYEGRLTRLGPTIDEQNRILTVEADVRNPGTLRPGSFARIDIVTDGADQAIVVPTRAIVSFAGVEKVFVVQDAKAAETSPSALSGNKHHAKARGNLYPTSYFRFDADPCPCGDWRGELRPPRRGSFSFG
jgi:multidrug efflux pump subunit AcrA (membrane-fusion protein)